MGALPGALVMRPSLAILFLLHCLAVAGPAQTARQEKTIDLPAGVSVELGTISHGGNVVAGNCRDRAVPPLVGHSGGLLRAHPGGKGQLAAQFFNKERILGRSSDNLCVENE